MWCYNILINTEDVTQQEFGHVLLFIVLQCVCGPDRPGLLPRFTPNLLFDPTNVLIIIYDLTETWKENYQTHRWLRGACGACAQQICIQVQKFTRKNKTNSGKIMIQKHIRGIDEHRNRLIVSSN